MSEDQNIISRHLVITGRVQGVSYRAWLIQKAEIHGVHGWVKNRHNGTVEAILHGPEDAVNALIEKTRKGPDAAHVTDVVLSETSYEGPAIFEMHGTD